MKKIYIIQQLLCCENSTTFINTTNSFFNLSMFCKENSTSTDSLSNSNSICLNQFVIHLNYFTSFLYYFLLNLSWIETISFIYLGWNLFQLKQQNQTNWKLLKQQINTSTQNKLLVLFEILSSIFNVSNQSNELNFIQKTWLILSMIHYSITKRAAWICYFGAFQFQMIGCLLLSFTAITSYKMIIFVFHSCSSEVFPDMIII